MSNSEQIYSKRRRSVPLTNGEWPPRVIRRPRPLPADWGRHFTCRVIGLSADKSGEAQSEPDIQTKRDYRQNATGGHLVPGRRNCHWYEPGRELVCRYSRNRHAHHGSRDLLR
jgi:hypothetical protein